MGITGLTLEGPLDAYRFVVVYRSERQSVPGDDPTWRGWVEQVYPTSPDGQAQRLWFRNVNEVSALIAKSIPDKDDTKEAHDA
ncbi:MAG: hypothetical protein QNI90_13330 [Dinoroseobacter sp.]|nr:hypothetical protein [Dinoroseobacter sp.]